MRKKKIVVIGGGFAGMSLVKKIDRGLFDILLIDKINHHQFQPLFYQVAASQVEPSSISFPLRHIFKNRLDVQMRLAQVLSIEPFKNRVISTIGEFRYDYLVIAIGCKTNFFGNDNILKHSLTLKSTYDAINVRNHLIQSFESSTWAVESEKESLLNLVIVGAGPTGVELAGAFAEIKKNVLPKDYHGVDFSNFKITLIEGSKATLNNMSSLAKAASHEYLESMGVQIFTETIVKDYDGHNLLLNNGDIIKTKTVIWTAGVIGNSIDGLPNGVVIKNNRIKVNRINRVIGSENIYAIGDIAYMETPKYTKGHPQVANVAINQARVLAKNFKKMDQHREPKLYEYRDLGSMATIGRNKAVVDLPYLKFKGYIAWLVWMFLHLMLILSVRNKLIIFINWAWAYFTKGTSLGLLLKKTKDIH